ncbi:MAG TPA: serpin family protein [Candidatus Oscillibacter excrementigallinarum]|uniref:Serpin family protein n=1 Tax=Candidatus Oscillibacter excrementigallinarum TaxID=2838716 RepID=A0A9D2RQL6_9FIRM|nr:serpin family protein [Candidatus Oscillibacter excrementigallinarum]
MKRTMALFLSLLLLLLTACGGPSYQAGELKGDPSAVPAVPAEMDLNGAADAVTGFAVELLRQTDSGGSTLLSPVSVVYALAMTANGAAGETLTQMESVLGLPLEELNACLRAYADQLPAEDGGRCSLANSIWLRDQADRLTVEQSFLDAAAAYYDASVFRAPFDESTLRDINAWVSDHTGGLIPSIVEEIPESAVIYLINALAFEGEWEDIYREDQVHDGTFTTEDGREQPAELMYGAETAYLEDDLAAGFLKYYQGQNYAFAALLPNEGVSLDAYLSSLTGERLRDLLTQPQDTVVQTAIPKFTAETTTELNDALSALGMADAFDVGLADFSAMGASTDGPLYISRVLHKTHLTLDERGTRAGAATAVQMDGSTADPLSVYLTRPFLYVLMDCEAGLPLFIGTVRDLGT